MEESLGWLREVKLRGVIRFRSGHGRVTDPRTPSRDYRVCVGRRGSYAKPVVAKALLPWLRNIRQRLLSHSHPRNGAHLLELTTRFYKKKTRILLVHLILH